MMSRKVYYVVFHGGSWKVAFNRAHIGTYRTQGAAIKNAVAAAQRAGINGFGGQVLVQGRDGQFRTEWTYGHDPYPPRG